MISDYLRMISLIVEYLPSMLGHLVRERLAAAYHGWTYRADPGARNVVIVGGSFAGMELAKRLSISLPTGYRVVLVERNSHLNFLFNFPRFNVVEGHEHLAFLPYDDMFSRAESKGVLRRVQGTAVALTETHVELESGERIPYELLALATGCSTQQALPSRVTATERDEACWELRRAQAAIRDAGAKRIAVVGAGAVGIEVATDIKSRHPNKEVTVIHSRDQLLNGFGPRLGNRVREALDEMGIRVLFNERPVLPERSKETPYPAGQTLTFADGHDETFDIIIPCIGQKPNSSILTGLHPEAISKSTSEILVKPTLQIEADGDPSPRIFALGDVAATGGPRMARAAYFQANVVRDNMLAMLRQLSSTVSTASDDGGKPAAAAATSVVLSPPTHIYTPWFGIEGSIKLTLGLKDFTMYAQHDNGAETLIDSHKGAEDNDIRRAWALWGANLKTAAPAPPPAPVAAA
ncbi:putative AMID-like mitochondrial oxidoreductase [Xylariales sp. PMI_506]|nr:putative AMID-like mitochondrial oxidoreductase [Xylariales sp. PMI_506]